MWTQHQCHRAHTFNCKLSIPKLKTQLDFQFGIFTFSYTLRRNYLRRRTIGFTETYKTYLLYFLLQMIFAMSHVSLISKWSHYGALFTKQQFKCSKFFNIWTHIFSLSIPFPAYFLFLSLHPKQEDITTLENFHRKIVSYTKVVETTNEVSLQHDYVTYVMTVPIFKCDKYTTGKEENHYLTHLTAFSHYNYKTILAISCIPEVGIPRERIQFRIRNIDSIHSIKPYVHQLLYNIQYKQDVLLACTQKRKLFNKDIYKLGLYRIHLYSQCIRQTSTVIVGGMVVVVSKVADVTKSSFFELPFVTCPLCLHVYMHLLLLSVDWTEALIHWHIVHNLWKAQTI